MMVHTVHYRTVITLVLAAIGVITVFSTLGGLGRQFPTAPVPRLTCPALPALLAQPATSQDAKTKCTIDVPFDGLLTQNRQDVVRRLAQTSLLGAHRHGNSEETAFNNLLHYLLLMDDNCSSLAIPETIALMQTSYFRDKVERHRQQLINFTVDEGFSAQVAGQAAFYAMLASQPWVRQVCEVGFNAGHSALFWLAASNTTRLLSFDLGTHPYSRPIAHFLSNMFPGRLQNVWGDSTHSVPGFISQVTHGFTSTHSLPACDVIVVDGGHTYDVAFTDLCHMRALARSARHVLIFDDTPCDSSWCMGPTRAWRELRDIIKPVFGCMHYGPQDEFKRGFSVGYYVV